MLIHSSSFLSWFILLLYFYKVHVLLCLIRCILDGLRENKSEEPHVPGEAVVKCYTVQKHKACECELSHVSVVTFMARSWLC